MSFFVYKLKAKTDKIVLFESSILKTLSVLQAVCKPKPFLFSPLYYSNLNLDFDMDGKPDNISFMIKRVKVNKEAET